MICKQCNAEVKEGNKFCTSCGSPMVIQSSKSSYSEIKEEETGQKTNWVGVIIGIIAIGIVVIVLMGFVANLGNSDTPATTNQSQSNQ